MPPTDLFKGIQLVTAGPAFDALGLVHRVRIPESQGTATKSLPTLVMVHGFQGNEDVTWVFGRTVGPEWLIISPRGPFPADSGYSWNRFEVAGRTEPDSFNAGLAAVRRFVEGLPQVYPVDPSRIVLLGFSQGAAMSYALASALNADPSAPHVLGVAALSGYVPSLISLTGLKDLPILMLHGTSDETIPIDRAHADRDKLIAAGATLSYREDPIGHKVSAAGMRELAIWFAARLNASPN